MENPQPLSSTESFSYSWLVDQNPNHSPENSREKEHNFNFNLPIMNSPNPLVHADEIFLDGQIKPVYINPSKLEPLQKYSSFSVPPSPISSNVSAKKQFFFPEKLSRSSKKLLKKCLGFMNPFVGFSRKSSRVDDLERKVCEVERWGDYSPRKTAYAYYEKADFSYGLRKARSWNSTPQKQLISHARYSNSSCCDAESSIHEAILYCKRSIEK